MVLSYVRDNLGIELSGKKQIRISVENAVIKELRLRNKLDPKLSLRIDGEVINALKYIQGIISVITEQSVG